MYSLTIRKLDDDIVIKLKGIAREKNMSLEALARRILKDYAVMPELKETEEKYIAFSKSMIELYKSLAKENKERIEENSYMLQRIVSALEGKEKI